jgi:predicted dithiol-disulfide oxidoreductase (DUF899 family)
VTQTPARPRIVAHDAWEVERARFEATEKELTRAKDALAAERRRLPMVELPGRYLLHGPAGRTTLAEMFEGRSQLIVYSFMYGPDDAKPCAGCSMFVDNLGHPAHLNARDTTLALVSRAPLEKLQAVRERMGWTVPWYSSYGSDFNRDVGATTDRGETFRLTVFLRDGERVFKTYATAGRGVEHLGSVWTLLDLTPYGRQETWEDSPDGWPQSPPYVWWRYHDTYAAEETAR